MFVLLCTWILSTWHRFKFSYRLWNYSDGIWTTLWLWLSGGDYFSPWGWKWENSSLSLLCEQVSFPSPFTLSIAEIWAPCGGLQLDTPQGTRLPSFPLPRPTELSHRASHQSLRLLGFTSWENLASASFTARTPTWILHLAGTDSLFSVNSAVIQVFPVLLSFIVVDFSRRLSKVSGSRTNKCSVLWRPRALVVSSRYPFCVYGWPHLLPRPV